MEKIITTLNLLPLVLLIITITISATSNHSFTLHSFPSENPIHQVTIRCPASERLALLQFKHDLVDAHGRLSSWGPDESRKECCAWRGVVCDNRTNHVTQLDLRGPTKRLGDTFETGIAPLKGSMSDSLVGLKHLSHLDLSFNDFGRSHIGEFVCSLEQLQYLNLANANFSGPFPMCIGNLSGLTYFDLNYNVWLEGMNLDWITHLRSLKYLDLSWTRVIGSIPDRALANHTSLEHLDLSSNLLEGGIPKSVGSLSGLIYLNLKGNYLNMQFSEVMGNLSGPLEKKLQHLELSYNTISGSLPDFSAFSSLSELRVSAARLSGSIEEGHLNIPSLTVLDLSSNNLSGKVPDFASSPSLKKLYLHNNSFTGLGESIGRLADLEVLQLRWNRLSGVITEVHLANLSKLDSLDLSFNSKLALNCSHNWIPPFNLSSMAVSQVNIGPTFPEWVQFQKGLKFLDIPSTGLADTIPSWFPDLVSRASFVNASDNQIGGVFNAGAFSSFNGTPALVVLDLSRNNIEGSVSFLCRHTGLNFLDLSSNMFSGHLPDCFDGISGLWFLNLADNRFSGEIPHSLGYLNGLQLLHLQRNGFSGEIPASMMNYMQLQTFDLGENRLAGNIPNWIGDSFPSLIILSLRGNGFDGTMPRSICNLKNIQVLDLSSNGISGPIPQCISNLSALVDERGADANFLSYHTQTVDSEFQYAYDHLDGVRLMWKGSERNYVNGLQLVKMIDLSNNCLQGPIPPQTSELVGLVQLNLSTNQLSGEMPRSISQLKHLDSLDLSRNNLSGSIPSSFVEMGFLGKLNLSYNNLSGRIPPQLLKFDNLSYLGNSQLCSGNILDIPCPGDSGLHGNIPVSHLEEDEEKLFLRGFCISMVFGFIVGFWGIYGFILCKNLRKGTLHERSGYTLYD